MNTAERHAHESVHDDCLLVIPANLDLQQMVIDHPPTNGAIKYWEAYAHLVDLLYELASFNKHQRSSEYLRIGTKILWSVLGSRYRRCVDYLIHHGVIERDDSYSVGRRSKGYRLTPKYRNARRRFLIGVPKLNVGSKKRYQSSIYEVSDDYPIQLLDDKRDNYSQINLEHTISESYVYDINVLNPHTYNTKHPYVSNKELYRPCHQQLVRDLQAVGVDETVFGHIQHLFDCGELTVQEQVSAEKSLHHILQRQFWFRCPDNDIGRVYTNVTNMPRITRPFMLLNGRADLVDLNIKTCQPLLLIHVLRQMQLPSLDEELEKWTNVVLTGDIYSHLAEQFSRPVMKRLFPKLKAQYARADMKRVLLTVFHCSSKAPYVQVKAFEHCWPKIASALLSAKCRANGWFSKSLQRLEAEIMLDSVVPALHENGIPLLTIHDGMIVHAEHGRIAQEAMRIGVEEAVGLVPTITLERLSNHYTGTKEALAAAA